MQPEHEPVSEQRDSSYFRSWWKHNGFWSCCVMDGLSVVFELPLESISALSESQKQALMRLLERLASGTDGALVAKVAALNDRGPAQRLHGLLELSSTLPT